MKKILLYQHGGSGNHGCEALVRTTYSLIKKAFPASEITLYSFKINDDIKYLNDLPIKVVGLRSLPKPLSIYNFLYHLKRKFKLSASKIPITPKLKKLVKSSDLVIAIGGDNYCYARGEGYYAADRYISQNAKKYVLFGCSIEPNDIPCGLGKHLDETFDLITVRESLSYKALLSYGLDNVHLVHDPAFLLKPQNAPSHQNAIGINLSPLVLNNHNKNIIFNNYVNLVDYVLKNTDMHVKLIPHVVWPDNDDRVPLTKILNLFNNPRITIVSDDNCENLKGIISSLRFFVGARTHSTIAAYSSCVPTLVTGYSVKAQGIATDIMGKVCGFVVPVKDMSSDTQLREAFKTLYNQEQEIVDHLKLIMPDYITQAESAVDLLKKL